MEMCSEVSAQDCFSNFDCPDDMRCENIGANPDLEVPCCVEGERGSGEGGSTCTAALDCESGVCIEGDDAGQCSVMCEIDEERCPNGCDDSCPEGMQRCIDFGVGPWCFPEN